MRAVPPSIDKRSENQKTLDYAVRQVHKHYGKNLRGFVLIAFDDNMARPFIAKRAPITNQLLADYAAAVLDFEIEELIEND